VMFKDIVVGIGKGSSKKQAEQDAARLALEKKVV
jgi:dsRNA-specific ribonuclease